MIRRSRTATVLWLLTIALFAVRIAGGHLHLCMDGQEPPVSLHMEAVTEHHGALDSEQGHLDRDVEVSASMLLIKKLAGFDELPVALLGALLLVGLLPVIKRLAPASAFYVPVFATPFALPPPPRGPPA